MPIFLYTLRLQDNCWYVGTTGVPPARLRQHREGEGSEWTRAHPVLGGFQSLKKLQTSDVEARFEEDKQVKVLMNQYGIEAVRGGSYSQVKLCREDVKALSRELWHAQGGCLRCGRKGHWANGCYARTDVSGNPIEEDASPPPSQGSPNMAGKHSRPVGFERGRGKGGGGKGGSVWGGKGSASGSRAPTRGCQLCGRANHTREQCFASTNVHGEFIGEEEEDDDDEEEEEDGYCFRCGRPGHWASECFARSHIDGRRLQ